MWGVDMSVYPWDGQGYIPSTWMLFEHFDWQVSSATQILSSLKTIFSAVEYLTLKYEWPSKPSGWNDEVHRARWRELLQSFSNVKTLRVPTRLIRVLSHSLQPDSGETPMELLPKLMELSTEDAGGAFADSLMPAGLQGARFPLFTTEFGHDQCRPRVERKQRYHGCTPYQTTASLLFQAIKVTIWPLCTYPTCAPRSLVNRCRCPVSV
ncbi:hypothetical protein F5148DRAFT_241156 [Russula earlei]|uniref:Uncharacterized protein n=1 Tax=Russula earlei TaxID=71964 RepID=A0ACC0U4I7_9AGAM|nr:hypothetical protein F5148DRAFT_241156 [Russula earlei]